MPKPMSSIWDNSGEGRAVADFLRGILNGAGVFRAVSAYFSIYGFAALQEELRAVRETRFLFGEPGSVGEIDPGGAEQKSFRLGEGGVLPEHSLRQKALARECAEWMSKSASVRSVSKRQFLHGKMYHAEGKNAAAIVGSSNFTGRGLGAGGGGNLEINLAADGAQAKELREWFDKLWSDESLTRDVKAEVLGALERMGRDLAPETVYYKTLYELFRGEIDEFARSQKTLEEAHLKDTSLWRALYDFQKQGAVGVIERLLRLDGCILADSVGLGKTYTALAVIKFFELSRNAETLVLCPKKLGENWKRYSKRHKRADNPFYENPPDYAVLSHSDLSRERGMADGIDLANFDWSRFHLVVIDESHNFRNDSASARDEEGNIIRRSRYERLLGDIIKAGGKTKVLMLSATPVNTSLIDLRNQISLMTAGESGALAASLGVRDYRTLLNAAQKKFRAWEKHRGEKNKEELAEQLGGEFFNLLGGVSIARSRRHIRRLYAADMGKIGEFPKRAKPENFYPPTDTKGELSYDDLHKTISGFSLAVYRPSVYLRPEAGEAQKRLAEEKKKYRFNQSDREDFLIGMVRVNFLKRLESSAHSLTLTLDRTLKKIGGLLGRIADFEKRDDTLAQADDIPDDDDDDEEFLVNRARHPFHLKDLDLPNWRAALENDRSVLQTARDSVAIVTSARDAKLQMLREQIRARAENPTTDKDGNIVRKILVFTAFKDTAEYLYENLLGEAKELQMNIAMVAGGGETRASAGGREFGAILTNFAPRARKRKEGAQGAAEMDILIATDCISEGQDLQDCDIVLNYDIHWNPVRLVQRFGRIDRIGSRNRSVRAVNYWPTEDMNLYLNLKNRVEARMALVDAAATGDDNRLSEEEEKETQQLELNFRGRQLQQLQEQNLDLEDLVDAPAISDFTMDYFLAQLLRYLQKNREQLEAMEKGVYAVVGEEEKAGALPGAVFFLRRKNSDGKLRASPLEPHYAVYVREGGEIRLGCARARAILELFEKVAAGKTEALPELCAVFDRQTQNGGDMSRINEMLKKALAHIVSAFARALAENAGARGFRIPPKNKQPRGAGDFELITWLVIMPPQNRK